MMQQRSAMMNPSTFTAQRGESECPCASFLWLILAGIAAAVSVLFISSVVSVVRLCLVVGVIAGIVILVILPRNPFFTAPKEQYR